MNKLIIEARKPLVITDLSNIHPYYHRILQLDPLPFYERLGESLSPYKRNNKVSMVDLFPSPEDGTCSCGCGKKLEGRRTRWFSEECQDLPVQIMQVLSGRTDFISRVIHELYGSSCCDCKRSWLDLKRPNKEDYRTPIELEHIIPVKHGGGGCWLSNYRFQCFECHRKKTLSDFGWSGKKKNK